jgi:acetoin utilization deacetylase AcuC-like enzyme
MNIFYTANHAQHHPIDEFFNGERIDNPEIPQRLDNILGALRENGFEAQPIESVTDEQAIRSTIAQLHDAAYLEWLENVEIETVLYPSVFNPGEIMTNHGSPSVQWGNFATDWFTPLLPQTWNVAFTTAQVMITAAQQVLDDSDSNQVSVALGRPPGHHAGRSKVGGYCFLNNAGIVAQHILDNSDQNRVAILDVDYHHGNGTQDIFYDRDDVVTCSIHADPQRKFPYFAGRENEHGTASGQGFNKNFPLEEGITNERYQQILEQAVEWIQSTKPQSLVISLGLDTHESDPIADFKLTTEYYQQMAATIAQLNLPTVIVLEGGYSTAAIGDNLVRFLRGMSYA